MKTIDLTQIEPLKNIAIPCFLKYPSQAKPQLAYIELSEHGVVTASADHDFRNAVPVSVWHDRDLRWPVDACVSGARLVAVIEQSAPLLECVHAGHTVEWDGKNMVGHLTKDAAAAFAQLEGLFSNLEPSVIVYSAAEWLWETDNLLGVWPECKTLDDAVRDAQPNDPAVVVYDDIRKAIVDEAFRWVDSRKVGLTKAHITALLNERAIIQKQANDYTEQLIS